MPTAHKGQFEVQYHAQPGFEPVTFRSLDDLTIRLYGGGEKKERMERRKRKREGKIERNETN